MSVTQAHATLIAASIAAAASVIALVTNLLAGRRAEARAAHRQLLQPFLADLSEGVHELLATATILRQRALKGQDTQTWITRGAVAAEKLKAIRPRIRYLLDGLDEPLRVLSRIPEWIATYRDVGDGSAELLMKRARRLAGLVDRTIARSYRRGLPPGAVVRWRARRSASALRTVWANRFQSPPPRWWQARRRRAARREVDAKLAETDA
jgi:hypothetical protein